MRWQLTTQLGVTWRRSPRGVWEIDGVPDAVLDEFSQRRDAIEAAVNELERILGRPITKNEVQDVVLDTRDAKQPTTVAELVAQWNDRAARHGFGPATINACFPGATTPQWDPEIEASVLDRLSGPQGLTENVNWFTQGDVIRTLVDLEIDTGDDGAQPIVLPPAEIEALAVRVLADPRIVELLPGVAGDRIVGPNGRVESVFTTLELLEVQERIRDRFAAGLHARIAVVPPDALAAALASGPTLDDAQQSMVRSLCTSGAQIQAAIGPPGSGKTATMATAAAAWHHAGYTVVGAAVKGEAARLLAGAAGIETNTLAWYLAHDDLERHPFDSRTVVVVDEASTISDRDLDHLIAVATTTGCAIRLIGDPAQHGSVGAGGSFRSLTVTHAESTPALYGNRRLHSTTERATADLVRAGQIPAALALMSQTGRLVEAASELEAQVAAIERWWHHRQNGDGHPMVDRVNTTRHTLNAFAHQLRVAAGEVQPAGLRSAAGLEFGVGDAVIAKAPARHLHAPTDPSRYVRNGSLGVVTASDPGGLIIDFDGIGSITMPVADVNGPPGRPGLDYAYAVTSYAVQGATFERSTSVITPASSQAELYVDITRGRHENVAIAVQSAPDDAGEAHLPRLPASSLRDAVAAGVRAKPGDEAVTEMDPLALSAARLRYVRSLAWLHAERRGATGWAAGLLERAEVMAAGAVDRAARISPPPEARALLGPRPTVPWQANRWDDTVASVAVYEARSLQSGRLNPLPHKGTGHDDVTAQAGQTRDPSSRVPGPRPKSRQRSAAGRSL